MKTWTAAVVHVDREVDGQLAARLAQDLAHALVEVQSLGGQIELALGDFPGVDRAATCSVVMERGSSVSGGRIGAAVGLGRLPDDPTGRAVGSRSDARPWLTRGSMWPRV